jgi:hypothetical protein
MNGIRQNSHSIIRHAMMTRKQHQAAVVVTALTMKAARNALSAMEIRMLPGDARCPIETKIAVSRDPLETIMSNVRPGRR